MGAGKEEQCIYKVTSQQDIIDSMDITEELAMHDGFSSRDVLFLRLVTEEICTNSYEHCVRHGYSSFYIRWRSERDRFEMMIKQEGEMFPLSLCDGVQYGRRGRGMQLVFQLMDAVEVKQRGKFVTICVSKKRSGVRREEEG